MNEDEARALHLLATISQAMRATMLAIELMPPDDPHWDVMHDAYFALAQSHMQLQKEIEQ